MGRPKNRKAKEPMKYEKEVVRACAVGGENAKKWIFCETAKEGCNCVSGGLVWLVRILSHRLWSDWCAVLQLWQVATLQ